MGNADSSDAFDTVKVAKTDVVEKVLAVPQEKTQSSVAETAAKDSEKSDPIDDDSKYPDSYVRWITMFALGIGALLVGLDVNIVGTAIPTITNEFHSANSIGWYTSANLLAASASQLYYGKLYSLFSSKIVLIASVIIFEIGSIVSGAAPSSIAFTIGRAISGLGRAGLFAGAFNIMKETLPLHQRPLAGSLIGAMEVIAIISAPVLGGILTTKASWRYCFFLNPPLGLIVLLVVVFLVPRTLASSSASNAVKTTVVQRLWTDFDHLGALLVACSAVCLLLALQWGGIDYPWSSVEVALPMALSGALLSAFLGVQYKRGANAVLPLSLLRSRTVLMGAIFSLSINGAEVIVENYLAIWFQMVKRASALHSGLMLLPTILGTLFGVAVAGLGTSRFGFYVPFMLVCSAFAAVATGLFQTFTVHASDAMWIGYQILLGIGVGCGLQQPFVAAQTYTEDRNGKMVGTATGVIMFLQTMGGTMGASIAQNIFLKELSSTLPKIDPSLTPVKVRNTGLTELVQGLSGRTQEEMLTAVNHAITSVFMVALVSVCLSIPASIFMPWKSVKKPQVEDSKSNTEQVSKENTGSKPENQSKVDGSPATAVAPSEVCDQGAK